MFARKYIGLAAVVGLSVAGIPAYAQSSAPVPSVMPGSQAQAMPSGSVPVTRDGAPSAANGNMQAIGGSAISNSVATASTPGALNGYGGLPSIDSAGAGNIAGLMSYCVRNGLEYGTAQRVVGRDLAKRPDVQNDQYYSLGGKGLLQTNSNVPFDISTLDRGHRFQICAQLAQRGQKLGTNPLGAPEVKMPQ
ncbi:hypothetical protein [Kozakia baliensis]|uniref:Uncharacterized protein n=1 Tax=Kozakia baliensis TaxID=153496 RepID=A0A1D8UWI7_9PROT|nr:hypothetical protein [Kozakia baliensis]AOX17956.1 hypothetical protein A0U89_13405 [Kozakia baliensis]GBR26214.1 hypothetical protein AA0488_0845 [Kozakia baliensis NRIC 0488]GEL64415.1 hypothetical protein KBA01_17010 [Kozakia baliensis]